MNINDSGSAWGTSERNSRGKKGSRNEQDPFWEANFFFLPFNESFKAVFRIHWLITLGPWWPDRNRLINWCMFLGGNRGHCVESKGWISPVSQMVYKFFHDSTKPAPLLFYQQTEASLFQKPTCKYLQTLGIFIVQSCLKSWQSHLFLSMKIPNLAKTMQIGSFTCQSKKISGHVTDLLGLMAFFR